MDSLELGTFINCKDLPIEKVEKLLERFVELFGDNTFNIDDISELGVDNCYILVYKKEEHDPVFNCINFVDKVVGKEVFYEDIFPEQL